MDKGSIWTKRTEGGQRQFIPRFLVVDFKDRPQRLDLPLPLVVVRLGLAHLALQLLEGRLYQLPALGRRLLSSAYLRHPPAAARVWKVANCILKEDNLERSAEALDRLLSRPMICSTGNTILVVVSSSHSRQAGNGRDRQSGSKEGPAISSACP
jgi:hypothetical protein